MLRHEVEHHLTRHWRGARYPDSPPEIAQTVLQRETVTAVPFLNAWRAASGLDENREMAEKVTNFTDADDARAAAERLAKERG